MRVRKRTRVNTSNTTRIVDTIYLPGLTLRMTSSGDGEAMKTIEAMQEVNVETSGIRARSLHWETGQPAELSNDLTLKQHPKYGVIFDSEHADTQVWARKCKAGLYWATRGQNPDLFVHFILDDLDQGTALDKSQKGGRSVTASEIRWLYRNRLDEHVQQNVQFWERDKPVAPPWTREYAAALADAALDGAFDEYEDDIDEEVRERVREDIISGHMKKRTQYKPKHTPFL